MARALHESTYPDGEFLAVEAASAVEQIETLLEKKQARLDLLAGAGTTVYVHEIGDASAEAQLAMLRLFRELNETARSVRLVASSSKDLGKAARDGFVRPELAYRFPFVLEVPPLRERASDITALATHFAAANAHRQGHAAQSFSADALRRLEAHNWPGNVRELCHLVERCSLMEDRAQVEAEDLPRFAERESGIDFRLPITGIDLAELEREVLVQALQLADHNQTRAAALLALTRDQIRYRMAKFGLAMREPSTPPPPASEARRAAPGAAYGKNRGRTA